MIPLKLVFSGLNSYRGPQEVDFRELSAQGLFGVFGVTGAGKSTLLDAITLALFGQVNRSPRLTQGIINSRESRCRVSFSFSLAGHTYLAERVLERVKNDPFAATVKSCRLTEDGERVLADKSEAMNAALRELLNMDCGRFCQTVILPQGQFDQLLKLRPAERSAMLEELFHLQDYGKGLSNRANAELRLAEAELAALNERLAALGQYSAEYIADLRHQLAVGEQNGRQLAAEERTAHNELHQAQLLAAKEQERLAVTAALVSKRQESGSIQEQRRSLAAAQAAEPLRDWLAQATSLHQLLREAEQAQSTAQRQADLDAEQAAASQQELDRARTLLAEEKAVLQPRMERLKLALHDQEQLRAEQEALSLAEEDWRRQGWPQRLEQARLQAEQAAADISAAESRKAELDQEVAGALVGWEQAVSQAEAARQASAAAYLASSLREGEPCPVCGSRQHQPPPQPDQADLAAAEQLVQERRQQWQQTEQQRTLCEDGLSQLRPQQQQAEARRQSLSQQMAVAQAELDSRRRSLAEKRRQLAESGAEADPATALAAASTRLAQLEQEQNRLEQQTAAAAETAQASRMLAAQTKVRWEEGERQLRQVKEKLLAATAEAGFANANEARLALLPAEERQRLSQRVTGFEQELSRLEDNASRLEQEAAGFCPGQAETAQARAEAVAQALAQQQDSLVRLRVGLERAEADSQAALSLGQRQQELAARRDVMRRLATLLKGNAFVRYLCQGKLAEVAHDASQVLTGLTGGRYQLELTEEGRGGDFIMADNFNGGVRRQVSGLSGGETFLVSLALALAMSRKIEMHSAPLGFFFLDEGFGSLDEASLEAALTVLERLPSDRRAVGLITHVSSVRERVPRYLEVVADPVGGSQLRLVKN